MSQTETAKKFENLILDCDVMIKGGKISQVRDRITSLNFAQVPRSARQGLAKICRRVGLVNHGLRLLQPVIRSEKKQMDPATPGEVCEYSVLLSRNGSNEEAKALLTQVEASQTPEASLYLAYCHIATWDYSESVPFLQNFLRSTADDYAKLIARVNLASAFLETSQFDEAENLLAETIPLAQKVNASRLAGNCYEIWGQVHFLKGDFEKSRQDLAQALEIFGNNQVYDQLLTYKTQATLAAYEQKSVEPLQAFRQEALSRKHWEMVREADLYILKVQFNQNLLDYLYHGTPMKSLRERMIEVGQPSSNFIFGGSEQVLNLKTGQIGSAKDFNPGKKIHQVLAALVRDAYAPRNIGSLFSELYPTDYFDINSSPARVKQLLVRTRQWFKENSIQASIELTEGAYRLQLHGNFGIEISSEIAAIDTSAVKIEELRQAFPDEAFFTADQACSKLNWSRSSFLRLTEWAFQNQKLQKSGIGKATRYQVPGSLSPASSKKKPAA